MDITLVTSSFDNVVHGTENDRKTGCGINLLKPENVTRFHRTSRMTDLKEITCEKCKANLAKKLIKADKKEMALLLKEEKKREKMGIVDEGIVPLGNTTAKITKDPDAQRKEEEARRAAEEAARIAAEEKRAAEEAAAEEAAQYFNQRANNIPGTSVPIDESLAEFAISVPTEEENTESSNDDFLAQFAIQKPEAQAAAAPSQSAPVVPEDDFLAQFAIPSPQSSPLPPDPAADMYYNEEPQEMDGLDVNAAPAYNQPAYSQTAYEQPAYNQPAYEQPAYNQPAYEQPAYNQPAYEQPAYNQPAYEQPAYEQPAYNQPAQVQGGEDIMKMFSIDDPAPKEPAYSQPVYNSQQPVYENEQYASGAGNEQYIQPDQGHMNAGIAPNQGYAQSTEQYTQPNQAYGYNNYETQPIQETAPVYPQYDANQPKEMEELPLPTAEAAPVQPVNAAQPAPVINDIQTIEEPQAPVLNEMPAEAPVAEPAFEEIPQVQNTAAQANANIPDIQSVSAPVIEDISTPVHNMPTMAEQEYDMSDYNYTAPVASASPSVPKVEAEPQVPQQPQIIKVPQFAGYDANNQPIYKYVQMKLVGVDQKGQPVYVPVQQSQIQPQAAPAQQAARPQAAPAQQTAAQAQRAAAAPVPQAPVRSAVPKRPVQQGGVPTANISKIAVNPHSKATSQAFINAIASSKEYADKNLIDTQGLRANTPVLTSIEDVLSTMGDDSAKKQLAARERVQQAVPVFDEYKGPQAAPRRAAPAPKPQQPAEKDVRYMSKAELKAKKKQDKIDAKFKKEMSKRGF